MSRQYTLWIDIQDIIGPANDWPKFIRTLFWTKHITHFQRILLVAFVYVNGLHIDLMLQWSDLLGLFRDRAAYNHFIALHKLIERGNYKPTSLYAYNIFQRRYEYLDGTVRTYVHKSKRL